MNRPSLFVIRERDTRVSADCAVTVAFSIGRPSGAVTRPVMISVVLPTCAASGAVVATHSVATTSRERISTERMALVR